MRISIVAVGLSILALVGCAASPGATDSPPPPPASASPAVHPSLSGEFVAQGAETTGTVSLLRASDTQFAVILRGFATGAGNDLRPNLSKGALVKGTDGAYYVDDTSQFELPGTIDPDDPEQVFFYPIGAWPDVQIKSFTVYDYTGRAAFGSAALAPADVKLPGWASPRIAAVDSGARAGAGGDLLPGATVDAAYVVVSGDTASDIAARFGVGLEQLINEDGVRLGRYPTLTPGDHIFFGTPLTGSDYDCFAGTTTTAKGASCYDD